MLLADSFWTTDNPEVNRSKADFPLLFLSWRDTILELEPAEGRLAAVPTPRGGRRQGHIAGSTAVSVRRS
jgi:hypothetical protein